MFDAGFKALGYNNVPLMIIIPPVLTIVLFAATIFVFLFSMIEKFLMNGNIDGQSIIARPEAILVSRRL